MPLLHRQQRHLGPFAGDVAGRDDAWQCQLGHETDPHRAGRREERSRTSRRAAPAGSRRRRFQAPGRGGSSRLRSTLSRTAAPARLAATGRRRFRRRPLRPASAARRCARRPRGPGDGERGRGRFPPPARLERSGRRGRAVQRRRLRHRVDETGAADAGRLAVSDHLQFDRVFPDPNDLDSTVCGTHAAPDLGGLERRACRRRRADETFGRSERDLAVRADVDEEAQALARVIPVREQTCDDVAADVRAEGGEDRRAGARVQPQSEPPRRACPDTRALP